MSESVSKSRKPQAAEEKKGEKFVPSASATTPHPREELTSPPFSIQELRDCIPAHCFVKSNLISFTYLAVDLVIVTALLFVGAYMHFQLNMPWYVAIFVWPLYALVQVRLVFESMGALGTMHSVHHTFLRLSYGYVTARRTLARIPARRGALQ